MCASSKNGEIGLFRPDLDSVLGWSQIFSIKIATQTCTIRKGVNLPHKFHLYLIFSQRSDKTLLEQKKMELKENAVVSVYANGFWHLLYLQSSVSGLSE